MTSVWPVRMCAGAAASVSHTMMCLSFEPDTIEPSAVVPTAPTKCVWPNSVLVQVAAGPPAASQSMFQTRTVASRDPVST